MLEKHFLTLGSSTLALSVCELGGRIPSSGSSTRALRVNVLEKRFLALDSSTRALGVCVLEGRVPVSGFSKRTQGVNMLENVSLCRVLQHGH